MKKATVKAADSRDSTLFSGKTERLLRIAFIAFYFVTSRFGITKTAQSQTPKLGAKCRPVDNPICQFVSNSSLPPKRCEASDKRRRGNGDSRRSRRSPLLPPRTIARICESANYGRILSQSDELRKIFFDFYPRAGKCAFDMQRTNQSTQIYNRHAPYISSHAE